MSDATTKAWRQYEKGKAYKRKLNLYETVDKCERFYADDQWHGVVSNGLPTPVFNFIKRVTNFFISAILSQKIKLTFEPMNVPEDSQDGQDIQLQTICAIVNNEIEKLEERLKMEAITRHLLRDGAISGDMALWVWWNENLRTASGIGGVEPEGDIDCTIVDNISVMFGNPNDARVEDQPYILVIFRELVSALREEAKQYGVSDEDIARITADEDYQEQSGDRGKIEIDADLNDEDGKATVVVRLWKDKESSLVSWSKSTRGVDIRDEQKTELKKYQLAWTSWDFRKNSMHGQSLVEGIIPNQIFVNKGFAAAMKNMMDTAFPKAVYNTSLVEKWSNAIGEAIPVTAAEDIGKVAMYLNPSSMSGEVMPLLNEVINITKDLLGATDAMLGSVKPDNHAAIVAVTQSSMVPLETIRANLYQMREDIGYIFYDHMAAYYGVREVISEGQRMQFDFSQLRDLKVQLKVEVGPSSYWSEIATVQTLDGLLKADKINFLQYLKRLPDGYIPDKEGLIDEVEVIQQQQEQMQQMQAQQQAQAQAMPQAGAGPPADMEAMIQNMPPELAAELAKLPKEQAMQMIQEVMGGQ